MRENKAEQELARSKLLTVSSTSSSRFLDGIQQAFKAFHRIAMNLAKNGSIGDELCRGFPYLSPQPTDVLNYPPLSSLSDVWSLSGQQRKQQLVPCAGSGKLELV